MADRFVCRVSSRIGGESFNNDHLSLPADFHEVFSSPQVCLFANQPITPFDEPFGSYSRIGLTWRRSGGSASAALDNDRNRVSARTILNTHWGAFVAFRHGSDGSIRILRDPSGQLPCYFAADASGWTIASDIDLLAACSPCTLRIDWSEVEQALLFINHCSSTTPLTPVKELLPGTELIVDRHGARTEMIWSPWVYASEPITAPDDAVARLRDAFEEVHQSLAKVHSRPLITISGGLDSSIVATQIADGSGEQALLTFYTEDDQMGDERHYARIVARACAAPLKDAPYLMPDFDVFLRNEMILPRPTRRNMGALVNMRILDQAFLGGNALILGGHGGDNIFHVSAPAYALRDRLTEGASLAELSQTIRDVGKVASASPAELARHAFQVLSRHWRGKRASSWRGTRSFLAPHAKRYDAPIQLHPWLDAPTHARPGTIAHIASLISAHTYSERFHRSCSVTNLSPLLMAPIVEACLAIPSWLWCLDGKDRAIARLAAARLPPEIATRVSKGTPSRVHAKFFETFAQNISEFLCEGLLAQHRIIDTVAVRNYCDRPPPVQDHDFLRLIEIADAEIWCRHWHR